MGHITKEIKEKYLPEVLRLRKEGLGCQRISQLVPIAKSTIGLWLSGHPNVSERENKHRAKNGELTESVYRQFIQLYCVEKVPPARIVEKLPVSRATIYAWVAKFEASKDNYDIKHMGRNKKTIVVNEQTDKEIQRLRKENEALRRKLKTAELDKEAFQTLIKICERDYKLSFTKKNGTKQ